MSLNKRQIFTAAVLLLLAYGYMRFVYKPAGPIVRISTGSLRGSVARSRSGKEYFEFLGIPYAKPPVGNLRFEVSILFAWGV